jgi:hypothetical protein
MKVWIGSTCGLILSLLGALAHANAWDVRVHALTQEGRAVSRALVSVTSADQDEGQWREVRIGDKFPLGTAFRVSANTKVVLRSSHRSLVTLHAGSLTRLSAGSDSGEEFELEAGKVDFEVKPGLSFFRARHGELEVQSDSGRFEIQVVPRQLVQMTVKKGHATVVQQGILRLDADGREAPIIYQNRIQAGTHRRFVLDGGPLIRFDQTGAALAHFQGKAEGDKAADVKSLQCAGRWQLSMLFMALGRSPDALPLLNTCQEQLQSLYPTGLHPDLAFNLRLSGNALRSLKRTEGADPALQKLANSLRVYRQLYPQGLHPNMADVHNDLGQAHLELGTRHHLELALVHFEQSRDMLRRLHRGFIHARLAEVLVNIGNAHSDLGGQEHFLMAVSAYQEAL